MVPETDDIYAGLHALLEDAFPKRCPNCGRVYPTLADFLRETKALRPAQSGLKQSTDDEDQPIVELFRNCVCGSTLMDMFGDRRDFTDQGQRRRERFQALLDKLEQRGVGHQEARRELLKVVHGERSEIVEFLRPED